MRVEAIRDIEAGDLLGRAITLRFDKARASQELFILVPAAFGEEINRRDDAFLPALVMAALVNREDVDLGGMKVDPLLLRNCIAAARQHQAWVNRFRVPEVTNFLEDAAPRPTSKRVASFFSGGVDSLFTLLRHSLLASAEASRITDENICMTMHVFHSGDAGAIVRNTEAEASLGKGATSLGAAFVPVFSNIMSFDYEWYQNYARVTHAAGLASIARLMSNDLSDCLIASSHTYGQLQAWGSSPIVDGLYSGRDLTITHDGSTFRRFEKTHFLARSPAALAAINVCDRLIENKGYVNCSRCQKCLRTMTALDLCGVSGDAVPAFDWSDYTPRSFGEIYLKNWSELTFAEELVKAAHANGRTETARSIRSAIRRSHLLAPLAHAEDSVRHFSFARQGKSILLNLRAGTYRALGLRR
jgi:hypothetical protein